MSTTDLPTELKVVPSASPTPSLSEVPAPIPAVSLSEVATELTAVPVPATPRELVEDALQSLIPFIEQLEDVSIVASGLVQEPDFQPEFLKVVDGITMITEAVTEIKKALRIGLLAPIPILEADLLSILRDLLGCQEKIVGRTADETYIQYMCELLRDHLPANLKSWRLEAIPVLIRSRDS